MAVKKEKRFKRMELAEYLNEIAEKLRSGTFDIEGKAWTVPEDIEAKIRFKEKKGTFATKLSWRWSSLEDYDPAGRKKVASWKDSIKTAKKKMGASFKDLKRTVKENRLPTQDQIATFVESTEAFAQFSEPEWKVEMDVFTDHLENLKRAVSAKDMDGVKHEIRDLQSRMVVCHKEFK